MRILLTGLIFTFLIQCQATRPYLQDPQKLKGEPLPVVIVQDISGKRLSSMIFRQQEDAKILVYADIRQLKVRQPVTGYHWVVFDERLKPWYVPMFWFKRRFKKQPGVIIDDQVTSQLKLRPGSYLIHLQKGYIQSIEKN